MAYLELFFAYFRSFQTPIWKKIVVICGIQTRNVGVEGEDADHHPHGPSSFSSLSFFFRANDQFYQIW